MNRRGIVILLLILLFPLTKSIIFYIQLTSTENEFEWVGSDQQELIVDTAKNYLSSGFYENIGQIQNEDVLFYGIFSWGIVRFQQDSIHLRLDSENDIIILSFEDSSSVVPIGRSRINQKITHIRSNGFSENGINKFISIVYKNLWEGIDLEYIATEKELKYEFHIQPRVDPSIIRINISGHDDLEIDTASVCIRSGTMEIVDKELFAYQDDRNVDIWFRETGLDSFGFGIGHYDTSKELVIDPLIYSTLIGGSDFDECCSVAVDANYYVYITGWTKSINFPIDNAFDTSFNGGDGNPGGDCFVLKLSPDGQSVVYSTFIGGTRDDRGTSITVDNSGNAYVTGQTKSNDFPIVNGFDSSYAGGQGDCFVFKLNAEGENLTYSTYVGGVGEDCGECITVNLDGNAFVAGWTLSDDFPTVRALDSTYDGTIDFSSDCFVFKLSVSGEILEYSTYVGGSLGEKAFSIDIDSMGNAYVTGYSASGNFPQVNSINEGRNDWSSCFVFKLNATGNKLIYSTLISSSNSGCTGNSIVVDSENNTYVTGHAYANYGTIDFPQTTVINRTYYGDTACIVFKLNSTGNNLVYSVILGGSKGDRGKSIAIDIAGNAYVTGWTYSSEFPIVNPLYGFLNPPMDCFLSVLNDEGNDLIFSTFIGGTEWDMANGLAIDNLGYVYLVGRPSPGFPTKNAYDKSPNGIIDCFLLKAFVGNDTDQDWIGDSYELIIGTNPLKNDTDIDGIGDYEEIFVYYTDPCNNDTDFDGMPDGWEIEHGLNATLVDSDEDNDNDGLSNLKEYLHGTNPNERDTDQDGFPDAWEITNRYDPRDPSSPSDEEIVQDYGIWFVGILVIGTIPPVVYCMKRRKLSIDIGPGI